MSPIVIPKPKPPEPKTKPVSLRLEEGLVKRLDAVAEETGNSRNETASQLIRAALDLHEKKPKTR